MKLNSELSRKPYTIVITGSIATGKSTASKIIKEMGYEVIDSDSIVHQQYCPGNLIYEEVLKYFGRDITDEARNIDRQKLGNIVFNNECKLKDLNDIVHRSVVEKLMEEVSGSNEAVIFLDIPLMMEAKQHLIRCGLIYDEIWLVYVNENIQKMRLQDRALRENKNPKDVMRIIESQIPIDIKKDMADEIINNEGNEKDLKFGIANLMQKKRFK